MIIRQVGAVFYSEHAAPPSLAGWVECAWQVRRMGAPGEHRVLPDGCIDVVWTEAVGLELVGANSTAFPAALSPASAGVGVRFRVGAAPAVVGHSGAALRDARLGAGEAWGDSGRRLEAALWEAPGAQARIGAMLSWLERRAGAAAAPDPLVREVAGRLARAPQAGAGELASGLWVSERQLRRRVVSQVGYGPKRLARVLRLQRALEIARSRQDASLAEVSYAAGYTDQPHFTNECVALAGVAPSRLLSS